MKGRIVCREMLWVHHAMNLFVCAVSEPMLQGERIVRCPLPKRLAVKDVYMLTVVLTPLFPSFI